MVGAVENGACPTRRLATIRNISPPLFRYAASVRGGYVREETAMTKEDRDLGMSRSISRRDFLNGVSVAVGGSVLAPGVAAAAAVPRDEEWFWQRAQPSITGEIYPPALTGMRGSGPG